ncbi:MAG: hypothetical protein ABIQ57_02045 [Candidatus Kapaibacterium sp.]
MSNPKEDDNEEEKLDSPPESWKKFIDLVRTVVNVPKEEIDRFVEEKRKQEMDKNKGEESAPEA